MAKRSATNDRFGGSLNHKKAKLDVAVQRRNQINFGASGSNSNNKFNVKKPDTSKISDNIWDDDDDDLMIISQMVENRIQSNDIICSRNSDSFNNDSITFELFGNNVKSSTQVPIPPMKIKSMPVVNEESSSLFDDSFDFEWEEGHFRNEKNDDIFKKPAQNSIKPLQQKNEKLQPKFMSLKNDNLSLIQCDFTGSSVSNDKHYDAIEVDKLIKSLDALQSENKKQMTQINNLSEQINDLNEKIQTKEGEASILRHELRSSKQALDILRVQKISENDNIRQEYQHKITELERINNVIQAELNQKKIENVQLKQKSAIDGNVTEIIKKYQELSEINKLNFRLDNVKIKTKRSYPSEIFLKTTTYNNSLIEKYFQSKFEELRSILVEWNHSKFNENHILKIESIFDDSMNKLIKYLELDSNKYNNLCGNSTKHYESTDINIDCTWCLKKQVKKRNIFFANKISEFEKMISFRRFMVIICFVIKNVSGLQTRVLDSIKTSLTSTESSFDIILQLIISSLNIENYFGILESIALVLTSLAKTESFVENYFNYIKIIIHCVPNLRIMAEISDGLQEISKNKLNLNKMCKKSPKFRTLYLANKKIVRIPKSGGCILQTFCTILEYKIQKQEKNLYKNKFEIFRILENYIKLLGNFFKLYPIFMIDPNHNNLTDFSNKNAFEINHSICNCYALACCSFIFTFSQFLKFWAEDKNSFDLRTVQEICRTGTMLICDIFDTHYQPVIIFIGNISARRNLLLILNYLEKNKEILQDEYENIISNIKNTSFTDTEMDTAESQQINKENGEKIMKQVFAKNSFF